MPRPKKNGKETKRKAPSASKAANGHTMALFVRFTDVEDRKILEDMAHAENKKLAEIMIGLIREAGERHRAKVAGKLEGWRLAWVREDGTVAA